MGGLYRSPGAFFSVSSGRCVNEFYLVAHEPPLQFYLIVLSGFLSLSGFFRLLGTLCPSYDHAARLASVLISIM
jgi:ATP-binding cassette subfamily G (WHITE) protein 2 (SNQ2)